jgi:hypothetical protein
MWEQHPLVLTIVGGVVLLGAGLFLAYLWDIVRPIPWQPHEVYRQPVADDADRPDSIRSRDSNWRGLVRAGIRRLLERHGR